MTRLKVIITITLFIITNFTFGQNNCGITIDTTKIFLDENLDSFIIALKSEHFQTFNDKRNIPASIKEQLDCLTDDKFSLANPKEEYMCCCTSSRKSPRRQLLFFSLSNNTLLMTYLTGGVGVSTTILLAKIQNNKIIDIWTGYGFPEFKSKEQVIKYINSKRKVQFELHGNVSL